MRRSIKCFFNVAIMLGLALSLQTHPALAEGGGADRNDTTSAQNKTQSQSQTRAASKPADTSALGKKRDQLAQKVKNLKKQIELAEQQRKAQQWTSRRYLKDLNDAEENIRNFKNFREATLRDLRSRGTLDPKTRWSRETLREKDRLVKEANDLQESIRTFEGWAKEADKKLSRVQDRQRLTEARLSKARAELRSATTELKKVERALR